ncbi:dTDP-4-dehydrorhamnose reductase [uncultured Winogradskyella sp.]|uniref:dTDP-4-dehydrorhamnose reductase n=1 Tax=uncultured Winogradskyella sp. TaxID=395353 RepID=UPI0026130117|nr:dTDP-4-dehydrorhamnose reductase [uncultured Winogradskyella sp.]
MKKVVVLGANGQLGQTLLDIVKNERYQFFFFSKEDIDITNKESLDVLFKKSDFEYCINCSAYTNVEAAETDIEQAFLVNAKGVKHIAEVCNLSNVKLIHISTDYVFDGEKKSPYKTDDETNPLNQYGKSKLKGELYIQSILKEHFIIRTSWLYSIYGKNFLKTIINKVDENKELKITTEEVGTPTSCIDLSNFIIHLITKQNTSYGIYNLSAKGQTTWYGFAREITYHYSPKKMNLIQPADHFKTVAKRPKYTVLDMTKTSEFYDEIKNWEASVKDIVDQLTLENNQ